jgi:hypothetical protein
MTKNLIKLAGTALALISASCAYDPYYSPYSVNSSYSIGYGQGFGWGGPAFSTSVFVGTGNPRWGYDPYCRSYFDYNRRCYYDPYLSGYYPIGYRPPVVFGVPHPHGWNAGRGFCPPPSRVTSVTLNNYQNREFAYRRSNYGWANQVRQQTITTGRPQNRSSLQNPYTRPSPFGGFRTQPGRGFSNPDPRQGGRGFSPSQMNVPNTQPQANFRQMENQRRQQISPAPAGIRPIAPPDRVGPPPHPVQTSEPLQNPRGGFRGQDGSPYSGGQGRGPRGRY